MYAKLLNKQVKGKNIMAIIKNGILSEIKGSVGNITGRIIKGKNILSRRVSFRKPVNDSAALLRRERFKLCVKLGNAAGSIRTLRTIWKELAPVALNYFSYFIQSNYRLTGNGVLSNRNIISPNGGFPIGTRSISITSESLNIEINALLGSFNFNLSTELTVKLFAVIYLSGPLSDTSANFSFIPVEFDAQQLQLENIITFRKSLFKSDQVIFESYSDHKMYITLVTFDEGNAPVNFSSTLYLE
jgi:hypothetical protein